MILGCVSPFTPLASALADLVTSKAGRWWRFWAAVNDNSGYLGAGVVGIFVVVFGSWAIVHQVQKRRERKVQGVKTVQ